MKRRNNMLALSLALLACSPMPVLAAENVQAGTVDNRDILFLSSYSYTWPTVPLQIEGIESALNDSVTLDVEFMDTKMIDQELAEEETLKRIQFKEENIGKYDAVIVGDDAALMFAMKYREEIFDEIPIVFEGINNISYAVEVSQDPLITGVVEQISYEKNIEFARQIQPEADKIVAIVDDTVTGIGEQQQFFAQEKNYPELTFDVINGSRLTKEELLEEIMAVDEDTILLYLILSEDADGNIYSNTQSCHLLRDRAKVPVFRFVQAGIGEGVLGGNIVLHEESGRIAARMALEMLTCEDPSKIEMQGESPCGFYLDQNVLDRFKISDSLVPEGAEIINRTEGFWELHGKVVLIFLAIAACVMGIWQLVVHSVYERRKNQELEEKNQQLAVAVQDARKANEAKSKFLNSMSHDIRTPMNAIIGFTNIAMKNEVDENTRRCLEKISASSEHLLMLINDVLDISRVESGKSVYDPVPVNLCSLTDVVVEITQGFLNNRDLEFRVEKPEEKQHCSVLADPVRVREVLVNLLSNAVKFTDDGGTIVFSMGSRPGADNTHMVVWFSVSDTGCGMSEEFLPHVFEEFAQEEGGARTQYKGTGLGMAIAKQYVDSMGGTISVQSKKGEGSTFTVEIPLEMTEEAEEQTEEPATGHRDLSGLNVLMAEDNDLNAEIAMIQLKEEGMEITRVVNGKQAVELFEKLPAGSFDLILMDVMMPEMDGYEATRTIRAMDHRPDGKVIPIIAMTANAFAEDVQKSLNAGMNAHIAKPIIMDEVIKTIGDNIQSHVKGIL